MRAFPEDEITGDSSQGRACRKVGPKYVAETLGILVGDA
jgi:hypothetical protein